MTKNFLVTSASEPNISINQKLILKKKPVKPRSNRVQEMYSKNLNMGDLWKLVSQVLHFWAIFLIYIDLRVFREVSLFKVIYFTTQEKDFFALKPDNVAAYFRRRQISEMRHVHMFPITIS